MKTFKEILPLALLLPLLLQEVRGVDDKVIKLNNGRNFTMGTNPHLDQIFIGRCYAVLGSSSFSPLLSSPSSSSYFPQDPMDVCEKLWSLFSGAFQFKNDSNILPSAFLPFFSHPLIIQSLTAPENEALFWTGVSSMIPTYQTATNQFVMETSSLVEIVSDLMYCGSEEDKSGYDYESCVWGDFNLTGDGQWHGTWVSYWAAASIAYAPMAKGNITIMLRGSPEPFKKDSFFATCELPNLTIANITNIQIIVVPPEDESMPYDKCGQGSLIDLEEILIIRGMEKESINCVDDPPLIQLMGCLNSPLSPQCALV